jgi:hypothetical protein
VSPPVAEVVAELDEQGWAILPGVLTPREVEGARDALVRAAEASEARGIPTRMDYLDPGGCNVRVYDLIEYDPVFAQLAEHPTVVPFVSAALDHDVSLSNFSANIALPGSRSMNAHNDQSTVVPEPWTTRWTMNAIWCLDDVDEANGATRHLPGSHRFTCFAEVPADPAAGMVPFEAPAGAVVLMDGRLWHTSGANTTDDRERAMAFAFYARSFIRHQNNWGRSLSRDVKRSLSPRLKEWLGLGTGNIGYGTYLASAPGDPSPAGEDEHSPTTGGIG